MAGYDQSTIADFVDRVNKGEIILPAMQRDFVWKKEKIYDLFESLMRLYPIGTFICWQVDNSYLDQYAFNSFIKDYDESCEYNKKQRVKSQSNGPQKYLAVLDGQQRITSLVMGLIGSYTEKTKKRKADESYIYQKCILCIDVLYKQKELSDPLYKFQFIPETQANNFDNTVCSYWVPVREVLGKKLLFSSIINPLKSKVPDDLQTLVSDAYGPLEQLRTVLTQENTIYYYTAKDKNLSEVVEIFIRVNSQGKPLEASDLILSSATTHISQDDIHDTIRDAVVSLNERIKASWVTKDLILQVGLMCVESPTLSFGSQKVYKDSALLKTIFKDNWDSIIKALRLCTTFVDHIGFSRVDVPKNILTVLAYYFYQNPRLKNSYIKSKNSHKDCVLIRQWILRSIINNIFVDGTGTTLRRIRDLIRGKCDHGFPLDILLADDGRKNLRIDDATADSLLSIKYSDKRTLPLLAEICGYIELNEKEVDHIFAKDNINIKSNFKKLYLGDDDIESARQNYKYKVDMLPNLQLLDKSTNTSKGTRLYSDWVRDISSEIKAKHLLPLDDDYKFEDFLKFFDDRSKLLKKAILRAFPNSVEDILTIHGLNPETNSSPRKSASCSENLS